MEGCNSCKYLDEKAKKPGRTSGYLFYCKAYGKYVNAAKDSCDNYELDEGRSSYTINDIYRDSRDYNDTYSTEGCNSCYYLDEKAEKPGKGGGALYFCKKNNTYVNASKDRCEKWENAYRTSDEKNEIYNKSKNYKEESPRGGSGLFLFVLLIIFGIICLLFLH